MHWVAVMCWWDICAPTCVPKKQKKKKTERVYLSQRVAEKRNCRAHTHWEVAIHLSTNLYFICLWHLCSIFLCLHLSNFSGNLSLRVLPHTLTHLSFATCFSIWLLYHLTFHFSFHAPFFNLHLTSSYHCQRIRRLVVPSFTRFF